MSQKSNVLTGCHDTMNNASMFASRLPLTSAVALCLAALAAHAAPPAISGALSVSRIEMGPNGVETRNTADHGKPGDVLEYTAVYSNTTGEIKRDFTTTVPIPAGTDYIAGSAKPIPQFASTDGVKFMPLPLMREVRGPQGTMVQQEVPASEYRAIRWTNASLNNGQQLSTAVRVRISPVGVPVAAVAPVGAVAPK